MIKQLPCHCIHHLTTIYNSTLNLQYFPESWKRAQVITFPKPGKDSKFPLNRRPISLLDCLGKIYERILLDIHMVTMRVKTSSQYNPRRNISYFNTNRPYKNTFFSITSAIHPIPKPRRKNATFTGLNRN